MNTVATTNFDCGVGFHLKAANTNKATLITVTATTAAAKKTQCCDPDVVGKCAGNTKQRGTAAPLLDLVQNIVDKTWEFPCSDDGSKILKNNRHILPITDAQVGTAAAAVCCDATHPSTSLKCSGNKATSTDMAFKNPSDGSYEFNCGAGYTVNGHTASMTAGTAAVKKASCCTATTYYCKGNGLAASFQIGTSEKAADGTFQFKCGAGYRNKDLNLVNAVATKDLCCEILPVTTGSNKATCSCTCTNSYTGPNCATPPSSGQQKTCEDKTGSTGGQVECGSGFNAKKSSTVCSTCSNDGSECCDACSTIAVASATCTSCSSSTTCTALTCLNGKFDSDLNPTNGCESSYNCNAISAAGGTDTTACIACSSLTECTSSVVRQPKTCGDKTGVSGGVQVSCDSSSSFVSKASTTPCSICDNNGEECCTDKSSSSSSSSGSGSGTSTGSETTPISSNARSSTNNPSNDADNNSNSNNLNDTSGWAVAITIVVLLLCVVVVLGVWYQYKIIDDRTNDHETFVVFYKRFLCCITNRKAGVEDIEMTNPLSVRGVDEDFIRRQKQQQHARS